MFKWNFLPKRKKVPTARGCRVSKKPEHRNRKIFSGFSNLAIDLRDVREISSKKKESIKDYKDAINMN
jgi:hypothetical protein